MLDFCITLEARSPARCCSRHYRVEAGTDLFGVWLEISYGRTGTAGRSRCYILRDEDCSAQATRSGGRVLKGCRCGYRDSVILFTAATADAHRTHDLLATFQGHTTREDHDSPAIGNMDAARLWPLDG